MTKTDLITDLRGEGKNGVVALSGGLDSTVLTYAMVAAYGAENVAAISFDYKQRHNIELTRAVKTAEVLGIRHQIIDATWMHDIVRSVTALTADSDINVPTIQEVLGDPQPVTYVPFRNMAIGTTLAMFAETANLNQVALGIQNIDSYSYWDTTMDFLTAMNNVAALNRKANIRFIAPFVNLTKVDEILIGQELGVDFANTWTCYDPITLEDGTIVANASSPSSAERIMSFAKAGLIDPVQYNVPIDWDELMIALRHSALSL